jgi:hydrogenase expression/formation protein HypD
MTFLESFRNKELVAALIQKIREERSKPIRIMEVCGGHTMAIRKYGIQTLLPAEIELLSGPGCPVCVTDQKFIDIIIEYSKSPENTIVTYGDLIRVPGSSSSLDNEKAAGADIRIINSTIEALEIARQNPGKKIIFAAIGFETTTPGTALAILQAKKEKLNNFFIVSAHKVMPPVMHALVEEGIPIDGYIGPGHVCTISGSKIFNSVTLNHNLPIVISGFEPLDILESILLLQKMINQNRPDVAIQYSRLVSKNGNIKAQSVVNEVFEPFDENWRGIGTIPLSGLKLRQEYQKFDALKQFPIKPIESAEPRGCICGQILKGLKKPTECPLFGKVCNPSSPIGACMVSSEGACNASYTYSADL